MSKVYLVSCVGKKRSAASMAADLYDSPWFLKARKFVEAQGCRWFILSAEYGLVPPWKLIAPYERRLANLTPSQRVAWAYRVAEQLRDAAPEATRAVFLAGAMYRLNLSQILKSRGLEVEAPMEGLGIGQQLNWLNQQVKDGAE